MKTILKIISVSALAISCCIGASAYADATDTHVTVINNHQHSFFGYPKVSVRLSLSNGSSSEETVSAQGGEYVVTYGQFKGKITLTGSSDSSVVFTTTDPQCLKPNTIILVSWTNNNKGLSIDPAHTTCNGQTGLWKIQH